LEHGRKLRTTHSVYDALRRIATVYEHRFCMNASSATRQSSQSRGRADTDSDDCSPDESIC
jgi:hypothetical protein